MAVANSGSRPMRVAVVGEKVAGPAPGLADPAASPAPDVADAAAGPAPDLPDLAASPAPDLADPAAPPAPDLADAVAGRLERGGAEVFRVRLGSHAATGAIGGAAGGLAGDAPSNLPRDLDAGVDCCIVNTEAKVAGIELLESHLAPGAPLLTCCHAASATQTAARCGGPDRVVGFALLAPSDEREAVECARALQDRRRGGRRRRRGLARRGPRASVGGRRRRTRHAADRSVPGERGAVRAQRGRGRRLGHRPGHAPGHALPARPARLGRHRGLRPDPGDHGRAGR